MADSISLPKASARFGFRGRIVVDKCPYCGGVHHHALAPDGRAGQRMADCFRGEYVLTFESPSSSIGEDVTPSK